MGEGRQKKICQMKHKVKINSLLIKFIKMSFYQNRNLIVQGETDKVGNLWLGDYQSARNKKNLKADRIYFIITAGLGMKISYTSQFTHKMLPLYDHESENISRFFYNAIQFLDSALKQGNVLIHCFAGVSRSTTILAAYLMHKNSWTSRQTLLFIKKSRPYINPNKGFIKQLKDHQKKMNNFGEKVEEEKVEMKKKNEEEKKVKNIKIDGNSEIEYKKKSLSLVQNKSKANDGRNKTAQKYKIK